MPELEGSICIGFKEGKLTKIANNERKQEGDGGVE